MATGKKYYWLKLKDSFMTSDTIDFFMSQPNGAQYVVLYQMLCLKTINTNGRLSRQIGEIIIPYDIGKIKRDCKWFSEDTIRVALNLYQSFGLIYEDTDGTLVMTDHSNLVGSETDYADQKKAQRLKNQANNLPFQAITSVDNVHTNVHIDIRDKRIDIRDEEHKDFNNSDNPNTKNNTNNNLNNQHLISFEKFWSIYPKKSSRKAAEKEWEALEVNEDLFKRMVEALAWQIKTENWTKDNGKYIPYPSTWLNDRRWEDEPPAEVAEASRPGVDRSCVNPKGRIVVDENGYERFVREEESDGIQT